MLVMETIRKIRVRHRNGESIRKISRQMHMSRNTIRKFLRSEELGYQGDCCEKRP